MAKKIVTNTRNSTYIRGELVHVEGRGGLFRVVATGEWSKGGSRTVKCYAEPNRRFEWFDERNISSVKRSDR